MTARQQVGVVIALLALIAVIVVVGSHTLGSELRPLGTGTEAPDFTAQTITTPPQTRALTNYKGQVVLLNVWATWCAPCRAEMPGIEQLYRSYASRGFKVVAVSEDDAGMEPGIREFAREYGLTFDVLHDPTGTVQQTYQMTGLPESFLIGRDGVIRKKIAGAVDWNSDANHRLVARLLAE